MHAMDINIAGWTPEQVLDWIRGIDDDVDDYFELLKQAQLTGNQLVKLTNDDLDNINITKIGHQERILSAVEHLALLHYELGTETVQSLTLRLGCKALALHKAIKEMLNTRPSTHGRNFYPFALSPDIYLAVNDISVAIRHLVSWLDRPPFYGTDLYTKRRSLFVKKGLAIVDKAHEHPSYAEEFIMQNCLEISEICDTMVKSIHDSLAIQPATVSTANIRKKTEGEDLGIYLQSSSDGIHLVEKVKEASPAEACGNIQVGDELLQVNHQTVVGWHMRALLGALRGNQSSVMLTLKKRPCHVKIGASRRRMRRGQAMFPNSVKRRSSEKKRSSIRKDFLHPPTGPFVDSSNELDETEDDDDEDDDDDAVLSGCQSDDTEVFRHGREVLRVHKVDGKMRRSTVSGASPTLQGVGGSAVQITIMTTDHTADLSDLSPGSQGGVFDTPEDESPPHYPPASAPPTAAGSASSHASHPPAPRRSRVHAASASTLASAVSSSLHISSSGGRAGLGGVQRSISCDRPPTDVTHFPDDMSHPSSGITVREHAQAPETHTPTHFTHPHTHRTQSQSPSPLIKSTRSHSTTAATTQLQQQQQRASRIDSFTNTSSARHRRNAEVESDPELTPERRSSIATTSYRVNVIGGVAQRSPTSSVSSAASTQSPASLLRKKFTARRFTTNRRISCKDLGRGDCQGWLWKKREGRNVLVTSKWVKRWFVLIKNTLYYYKDPEDEKAQGTLFLPVFHISPAPEIKSKKYAFKAHHSGTTFYFASERQEDRGKWMNKMGLAAINYDLSEDDTTAGFKRPASPSSPSFSDDCYFSESEGEVDTPPSSANQSPSLSHVSTGSTTPLYRTPPGVGAPHHPPPLAQPEDSPQFGSSSPRSPAGRTTRSRGGGSPSPRGGGSSSSRKPARIEIDFGLSNPHPVAALTSPTQPSPYTNTAHNRTYISKTLQPRRTGQAAKNPPVLQRRGAPPPPPPQPSPSLPALPGLESAGGARSSSSDSNSSWSGEPNVAFVQRTEGLEAGGTRTGGNPSTGLYASVGSGGYVTKDYGYGVSDEDDNEGDQYDEEEELYATVGNRDIDISGYLLKELDECVPAGDDEDDQFHQLYREIRGADLCIDGNNKKTRRTSTLSPSKSVDQDDDVTNTEDHIELASKERTLKACELELSAIDHLLSQQTCTSEMLRNFVDHFPEVVKRLQGSRAASSSSSSDEECGGNVFNMTSSSSISDVTLDEVIPPVRESEA